MNNTKAKWITYAHNINTFRARKSPVSIMATTHGSSQISVIFRSFFYHLHLLMCLYVCVRSSIQDPFSMFSFVLIVVRLIFFGFSLMICPFARLFVGSFARLLIRHFLPSSLCPLCTHIFRVAIKM